MEYLSTGDSFVAIEYLCQQTDALAAVETYNKLLKQLYYEQRDIAAVISMGRAGIQHGLTSAAGAGAPFARDLKDRARSIAYNLASYTWPGWDELGIKLDASQIAQGLDAAAAAVRLSAELGQDALHQSRGLWMLAAHQLAASDLPAAAGNFKHAADLARTAQAPGEALLSEGFVALAGLLAAPNNAAAEARCADVKRRLAGEKDGRFFIEQLDTARRVFSK